MIRKYGTPAAITVLTIAIIFTYSQLGNLQADNQSLRKSNSDMAERIDELKTQHENKNQIIREAKGAAEQAKEQANNLREKLHDIRRENENLKQRNRELDNKLQAKAERQKRQESNTVRAAAAGPSTGCVAAIERTWPGHLQSGAKTVLNHENGQHDPTAVSAVNRHPDGTTSRDYGCFQINSKYHAGFFARNDWRDPVANARYAFASIYKPRGDFTAWYAVEGILW